MAKDYRKTYTPPELIRLGTLDDIVLSELSPARLKLILELRSMRSATGGAEADSGHSAMGSTVDSSFPPASSGQRRKG